ncbi:MAG: hypothetical protein FJ029_14115 [Actinobacteria bacterium]|nr:hypothetical protein [Actinomycetota bacterium]
MSIPPKRRVSARELRDLFNASGLTERAEDGTVSVILRADRHPSPPRGDHPVCTRSQSLEYVDANGTRLAVAHRYLRPDGTLGGSGRPDPKAVLVGGELLIAVAGQEPVNNP